MNQPQTGFYSLIQFCPDRARMECANVGVILCSPQHGYIRARTASANDRLRKFFGSEAGNLDQINAMKRMLERRVEIEASALSEIDAFRKFAAITANELLITPPRPVRIEDPEVELLHLYDELVGNRNKAEPGVEPEVIEELRLLMEKPQLKGKVRRNVSVSVPVIGEALTVPYAYQNGRLNLIEPHSFSQHRESDVLRDACKTAVEGHLLFKHPDPTHGKLQLVVVAGFVGQATAHRKRVAEVLREHDVVFYDEDTLPCLAKVIADEAH